ncbi:MAG: xanthine phosphoribosyltransferase [Pseudomonadota bacterium]
MTPTKLPFQKGFHVSWDRMHDDARRLALMLNGTDLEPDGGWRAILAITRGGMAPAMIVARELDVRTVETISIKSYNKQSQDDIRVLKAPNAKIMGDGTGILIVDDLVDSGKTLEVVRKHYPNAHFATVYAKPNGKPQVDTFVQDVGQDEWIYFPWDLALLPVDPYRGTD